MTDKEETSQSQSGEADQNNVLSLDRLCERALDVWGESARHSRPMEECGELSAAINQYHRGRIDEDELAGEIADVELCLHQLEMMLGESVMEDARQRKREALSEKLTRFKGDSDE